MSASTRRAIPALVRVGLALGLAWLGVVLAGAAVARADIFEPISLVSVGQPEGSGLIEQADVAEHPAISEDGRYVAFEGVFGGVRGIWRAELLRDSAGRTHTGRIGEVAGGDAELPSISENGQYVSFTTNEGATLPEITNGAPGLVKPAREALNVYVRNMSIAPKEAGAFTVASAVTVAGVTRPLSYSNAETFFGSVAAGRSAMSANGRYVAFVTTAESDLTDPATPAEPTTPALQVAVRDLLTKETKLISVEYEQGNATDRPVSTFNEGGVTYGAAYQSGSFPGRLPGASSQGASISADGSTVAWMGQEIAKQAPVLGGAASAEHRPSYVEPLWRRVASPEPARRVTGGGDPTSSACIASGETEPALPATLSDPCQGPFEAHLKEGQGSDGVYPTPNGADTVPRLSSNGATVAFLATQRWLASGEEFKHAENSDDLYVANMAHGLTRVQALRRLTEIAGGNSNLQGETAPITDFGVSPDGAEVAFSTLRTAFPLGSPAYVSVPRAVPNTQELYDVDLANATLTRVTHGYEGEAQQSEAPGQLPGEDETGSPSFTGHGDTITFSSGAGNLVYGEGNRANSVFVVARKSFAAEVVPQYISPPPAEPALEPSWLLGVTPRSRADGSVLLEVQTPGAGSVSASAHGAVRVAGGRSHASRRHRRPSRKAPAAGVATRRVASAAIRVGGEGLVTLALRLAPSYRALASRHGGLSASVSVAFAAPGHAVLRETIHVSFQRKTQPARRPVGHKSSNASRRR
jgi:hypothetical protein